MGGLGNDTLLGGAVALDQLGIRRQAVDLGFQCRNLGLELPRVALELPIVDSAVLATESTEQQAAEDGGQGDYPASTQSP